MTINYLKAGIAALSLICITVLMVTNSIDHEAGFGLIGTIVGYAVGNGIASKQGIDVAPMFYRAAPPAIPETITTTTQEGTPTNG